MDERRLDLSRDDILQHLPVQAQVGHELLQLAVLFFKLLETPQFRDTEPDVLLLPTVERLLRNPHLSGDLGLEEQPLAGSTRTGAWKRVSA